MTETTLQRQPAETIGESTNIASEKSDTRGICHLPVEFIDEAMQYTSQASAICNIVGAFGDQFTGNVREDSLSNAMWAVTDLIERAQAAFCKQKQQ